MREGLRTLLLAQSSIASLVGANGVYVTAVPQGATPPYVLLTVLDSDEFADLVTSGDFREVTVEIDAVASTQAAAASLAVAVRNFLRDYSGPAGGQVIDQVVAEGGERDSVQPPDSGSDRKRFVTSFEAEIQFHPR
jgi:hypothetical protein